MSGTSFTIKGLGIGQGGKRMLEGEISVGGAKNAALKVMAAVALFDDAVELSNVPEIEDVNRMAELLEGTGMKVEKSLNRRKIILPQAPARLNPDLPNGPAKAMRSSIVLTGPMLARMGRVVFPNPGGCSFGTRPIDMFLQAFERFGAQITIEGENYVATAPNGLAGMEYFFKVQTHTGTETMMMAATLAKGKTVLKNCALEPEVKSLADYLNACGAKISGAGTLTITIEGVAALSSKGKVYETLPDRIETGSFMILGALAGKEITIRKCEPAHVEIVTEVLRSSGVKVELGKDWVKVAGADHFAAGNIRTHEYPGLATDLQSPMAVFLSQADGESALLETIYEGRLAYIPDLKAMGANVEVQDTHRVLIKGPTPLTGSVKLKAPDLRAGFAFVIAAIIAKGESKIENAYVIDRGYENIVDRLAKLGVDIKRG